MNHFEQKYIYPLIEGKLLKYFRHIGYITNLEKNEE